MTTVVLVSHGGLADAMLRTAEMILGKVEGLHTVGLEAGQGTEEVSQALRSIASSVRPQEGALALLDLFGGSPATACARLMADDERIEVVTGLNLPMLLEVLLQRNTLGVRDLARLAREKGKEGIIDVRAALNESHLDT